RRRANRGSHPAARDATFPDGCAAVPRGQEVDLFQDCREPHAGGFELAFARFLDDAPDVAAFGKNYLAVGFKIDYVKADGDLSTYTPDFIIRTTDGTVWIVETKGRAELDLPRKMERLRQWCADATE